MRFGVLGPLAVWTDDGTPVPVPEPKGRTVLALLVLHPGRPVPMDRLVDSLWPVDLPANPANAVQTKVSQLRRVLEAAEPGGRDLVRYDTGGYVLDVGPESVDVTRFESLVERASACRDVERRVATLAVALALWRGSGVAELDDHLLTRPAVARLEEARLAAIEAHVEGRLELGHHREVVAELAAHVARHPGRERLHAAWMVALYRCGRHREALAAYADLRQRLAEDVGLSPSPDLQALELAILRHDPTLDGPGSDPPSRQPEPATARRTSLPRRAGALIGRADAIEETRGHLRAARLVTLVGLGGVGKTSLAAEVARGVADELAGGAVLVELASLDPAGGGDQAGVLGVAEALAAALGIATGPAGPTREPSADAARLVARLGHGLSEREMLVVLDNCEHVVEPVAVVADAVLRAAPKLRLLATSREPLRLGHEVVQEVPPLDLPQPTDSPTDVTGRSSVRLFAERAAAVAPRFVVDDRNLAAVADICRRLDGVPLAIELAAARMRALDVHDLARRLDHRFSLLDDGRRDAPARHRTLFAVVDWSWHLLDDDERTVLRRLAAFPGRFDLAAAEDVVGDGDVPRPAVAGLLARLVDRSVVSRCDLPALGSEGPADAGSIRYRLPESVAAHARVQPRPPGEDDAVRRRHRQHVTRLVARADAGLRGPDQRWWLRRMDDATADVRTAFDDAVQQGDATVASDIANAMAWYWFLRGRIGDARRSLRRALALPGGSAEVRARITGWTAGFTVLVGQDLEPARLADDIDDAFSAVDDPAGRAQAQWFLGFALAGIDDAVGEALNDRALAGFHATSNPWGCAVALAASAWHAWQRGDLAAASRTAEDAASRFAALGDRWGQLQAGQILEQVAEALGDYDRAATIDRATLTTARDLDLPGDTAYALCRLGRVTLLQGDLAAALDLHQEARRIAVEHSHVPLIQVAEIGLALCHRRAGELDEAEAILRRWLDWNLTHTNAPGVAFVAAQLGFVADQRGDAHRANALHDLAHTAALQTGDPRMIALTQEGQAGALALTGDIQQATALLAAAHAARTRAGAPLPPAERFDVDRITARLG